MAGRNSEVIRRATEIFDEQGVEAWLEQCIDPDVVYIQDEAVIPDASTFHGHEGMRTAISTWVEEFDEWHCTWHDFIDLDDGRVLLIWSDRGRGRQSGAWVERPKIGSVYTLKDGLVIHWFQYGDAATAFRDLGLTPPSD